MDNQKIYHAAILGGIVAALTDALPVLNFINCLCCIGIAAGGSAALFYLKGLEQDKIFTMPELVQIGLLTGLTGAFFSFGFHYIMFKMIGNWQIEWALNMLDNMEEIPALWDELYEQLQAPEMQGFAGLSILIRALIIFPIFTFLGALFTNRLFLRQNRQQ